MIEIGKTYWVDRGNFCFEEVITGITVIGDNGIPLEYTIECPFGVNQKVPAFKIFETQEEFLGHLERKLNEFERIAGQVREQLHQRGLADEVQAMEEAADMKMEDMRDAMREMKDNGLN